MPPLKPRRYFSRSMSLLWMPSKPPLLKMMITSLFTQQAILLEWHPSSQPEVRHRNPTPNELPHSKTPTKLPPNVHDYSNRRIHRDPACV